VSAFTPTADGAPPVGPQGSAHNAMSVEMVARLAVLTVVALAALQATYADRGLYADGGYYLWRILETHTFYLFPSRALAQAVTQIPVIVAIRVGVDNVAILARLQSLGTAALPMMIWALALFVLLKHRLFWPFVAVFAVTFLNSGFFSVGEYNFASALVALSAAILLSGTCAPWACAGLLISAMLLPLSYETMAFLGVLLAVLAFWRLRTVVANQQYHRIVVITLLCAIILYVIAAALNVWWTVSPPYPTSLAPVTLSQWIEVALPR